MPVLDFPEYAPDLTAIGTGVSPLISGAVPRADGYGPFPALLEFTQPLPGPCRGMFFARKSDSSIAIFAATATNLYLLNNTDFSWTNVSKAGGYSSVVASDNWEFEQFADTVLATQINTVVQAYTLSTSTQFADLAGSPPLASHIAVVGGFVVLSGISSNPRRVQWSDLFGITTWTAGVGLADFQDLADGGSVRAVAGGDYYGVIFQDDRVRRMVYVPGSAAIFDILVISHTDTLFGQYSVVTVGDRVFFCSAQGFKMILAGGSPVPIGKERIDRTFFADVDAGNLQLMFAANDPAGTRVFFTYKSNTGQFGVFNKMLCYDWMVGKNGRWSVIPASGEYICSLVKPSLTLENMDSIAPGKLTVLGAANNGSGAIRLTLDMISNANFSLGTVGGGPTQNFIEVYGVTGTTEANGSWYYTIVDATHIDLIGSTFVNAYISGGNIGGSLEAMTISLDNISQLTYAKLAGVSSAHKAGFFNGTNVEAILESDERENDGKMAFISSVRPITDCAAGMVSIASRNVPQAASIYSSETAIDTQQGQAPCLVEARYIRGRLRCPAGSTWTYAKGLQPEIQASGDM